MYLLFPKKDVCVQHTHTHTQDFACIFREVIEPIHTS